MNFIVEMLGYCSNLLHLKRSTTMSGLVDLVLTVGPEKSVLKQERFLFKQDCLEARGSPLAEYHRLEFAEK